MTKILMVCLGNICRSPLAEGILAHKTSGMNVEVDSAGTQAYHVGEMPDKRSVAIAKQNGIDITNQRARKFKISDFDTFNYIYVMDKSNYKNIVKLARNEKDKQKVKLILNEVFPKENLEVPDPYYGGSSGFENVFNLLNKACDKIVLKLKGNE